MTWSATLVYDWQDELWSILMRELRVISDCSPSVWKEVVVLGNHFMTSCWVQIISGLICMMMLCVTAWVNTDCYAYIPKCRTVAATIMFRYSSILPPKMQSGEPKWCWHTDKPGNWCLALLDIKVYSCLYNIWLSYNIILSCVLWG